MTLRKFKLGELATIRSGGGAPQDPAAFSAIGSPFIRAGSLPKLLAGEDESSLEQLDKNAAKKHKLELFPAGTILFAKSGMSATKGHIYQTKTPAYVVNHLAALIPKDELDGRFLVHALQAFSPTRLIRDQAYPSIRLGDIEDMTIEAPETCARRAEVAAILDKADALRQKRKQAIALLDNLTQSIFLEMFGDPADNPKNLQKCKLGDLIKVKSGSGLTTAQMNSTGAYSVYGGNGINGNHDKYMFEESMLVIGRVGVYCGAVHLTKPKSWITDNALYVSEYKRSINQYYLASALKLANLNQYAGRAAQPLVSGSRIYPVEILLPPKESQMRFETAVRKSEDISRLMMSARVEQLFSSLQHRAFSGQL